MIPCKLAFIGGGNMARSLIGGLIANGMSAEDIHVADKNAATLESLNRQYPVQTFTSNQHAIEGADVIIIAVKPQQLQEVVKALHSSWQEKQLLISIAAGIRIEDISRWLDKPQAAIVRAMPNTPALVEAGATALFANEYVSHQQHELAESILRACGLAIWLKEEKHMDAVTAVSGSGPAYFFLVMEAMENAAIELGLPQETARLLCLETAFGAAKMALESGESASTLRKQVTSPGGTTERAIHELEDGGLHGLFENALVAAALRARELANELGQDHA
ncbi:MULTISPECIES: pyrroline-5-carboxylate reductase [unclassified Methylophaga]|jgi:pyrroline-5-carboxylate reductase|uniref:pyrroline-5-carboxylate reductase n=3 Tax=Methylophaga TaxID=40222 RepID=UPI000C4FB98B|nr:MULTISPECIES: pyrroline-5-carboxylate reductase [unclassified Methylophaga]MAL49466.1 pyrroline-5-carboxylate reductase [Methylophaga sp.]MAP26834.1 pyrroline-5-carboxylate reductase [Methylophaga sp.]MBP25872.1 pyrroline-5-carboxylate reductase [Methylophaga sp.]HAD31243.1 pyrroline-5-carboxylate reductase [Methylophaga sp.]HCO01083.1 pyrroline-5-carboxylate reductase [Methylophaga sp.]|tara:strand:+ start:589 stop:1422 length:834 start_codon:yes stop_codon:yes gene_type:complete